MGKLYNKALFYQYFYTGKWAILFGIIIFSISSYGETENLFSILRNGISIISTNKMENRGILYLFILCVILFGIYIFITGFNKRSNLTFLNSSPFTRKEIKRNEILFLLFSLIIFVALFIYINVCLYYNERELLSISSMYIETLVNDTLRLFFVGFLFIVYLEFMDMIFSNTIFTIILMVVFPLVLLFDFTMLLGILQNIGISANNIIRSIFNIIESFISCLLFGYNSHGLRINFMDGIKIYLAAALIIAIGIVLINKINKKFTINNVNKFFSFILARKIFIWVISFSIVNSIASISISAYMEKSYYEKFYTANPYYTGVNPTPFTTTESILLFIIIAVVIVVLSRLLGNRINKLLEKII